MIEPLSADDVRQLPAMVDLETAGRAFAIGLSTAYKLAKAGTFPVPVLRVGGAWRVRRADLLTALDVPDATARGAA